MTVVPVLPPETISHIIRHAQPPHCASRESRERVFKQLAFVNSTWHDFAREEYDRWLNLEVGREGLSGPIKLKTTGNFRELGRVRFVKVDNLWEEEMAEGEDALQQVVRETFSDCPQLEELWYHRSDEGPAPVAAFARVDVNTSRLLSFLTRFPSKCSIMHAEDHQTYTVTCNQF